MLTDIKIGQFFPANSLLHKLDARLKIVSLFILIVGIFVFDSQLDYIIWCMLIGSLMYMSKIPLKMFFISIKPIIWIILFTFILHLFTTQGKVIFEIWKLSITWEGLAGNILKRVKAFMPILIPLFISAFRRADDLAMAMEARCYHGGVGRTRLKQLSFASRDYIAMTAFIGILLILTVIKIVFPHMVLFTL